MNEATRKKAIKVINRGIKFYKRELMRQLELEEVKLYASMESREDYYDETSSILLKTGLDFCGDEPGILKISVIEE